MAHKYLKTESIVVDGREINNVVYAYIEERDDYKTLVCQTRKGRIVRHSKEVKIDGHYILIDPKSYVILKPDDKSSELAASCAVAGTG